MTISRRNLYAVCLVLILGLLAPCSAQEPNVAGWYFPPAGEGLDQQSQKTFAEAGMKDTVVTPLDAKASRWALWRHGYLLHVTGDWNKTQDVASLRKTWHALTVGAAIGQGKLASYDEKIADYVPRLQGKDAEATWWHVITQSSGFDFPHADYPDVGDPAPGEVWTYSDQNPRVLCDALARLYGKQDFRDNYDDVAKAAYFDAIGMRGWRTRAIQDGVRFVIDLEDMGRLGLLALARGNWDGQQIIPRSFVEELEAKQTAGMRPVYNGPDDGNVGKGWWHEHRDQFPECPYGFMTWVNSDGDLLPGADRGWAFGAGNGGTRIMWNYKLGIVFAAVGLEEKPANPNVATIIEDGILGPNPLVANAR